METKLPNSSEPLDLTRVSTNCLALDGVQVSPEEDEQKSQDEKEEYNLSNHIEKEFEKLPQTYKESSGSMDSDDDICNLCSSKTCTSDSSISMCQSSIDIMDLETRKNINHEMNSKSGIPEMCSAIESNSYNICNSNENTPILDSVDTTPERPIQTARERWYAEYMKDKEEWEEFYQICVKLYPRLFRNTNLDSSEIPENGEVLEMSEGTASLPDTEPIESEHSLQTEELALNNLSISDGKGDFNDKSESANECKPSTEMFDQAGPDLHMAKKHQAGMTDPSKFKREDDKNMPETPETYLDDMQDQNDYGAGHELSFKESEFEEAATQIEIMSSSHEKELELDSDKSSNKIDTCPSTIEEDDAGISDSVIDTLCTDKTDGYEE